MDRVEADSLRRLPVLRIGLAAAVVLGSAGVVGGKILFDKLSSPEEAGATEQQPGGIMLSQDAFDRLVTVTTTSIPPPTEVPPPTATTERRPEKNPLQTYAAYASREKDNNAFGVFDPKTGDKVGGIVIASLPNAGAQLDNIFGYLIIQLPQDTRTFYGFLAQVEQVEGSTFVAQARSKQGIWDLEITQDGTKISGTITRKSKDDGPIANAYGFQAGLYGNQACSARDATRYMKGQEYKLGQSGTTDADLNLYSIKLPCAP